MGKASRTKNEKRAAGQALLDRARTAVESQGRQVGEVGRLPPGTPSVADSLSKLMAPYLTEGMDLETRRKLLTLAILAWNWSLLSPEAAAEPARLFLDQVPPEGRASIRALIGELQQRRLRLFPGARHTIIEGQLREEEKGRIYLSVAVSDP